MLDLDERQKNIVIDILQKHIPTYEVGVFGSRVNGTARKTSDIDLVIMDDIPVRDDVLYTLKEAFDDSLLDIKVDIVFWRHVTHIFQENIKAHYVSLQHGKRA